MNKRPYLSRNRSILILLAVLLPSLFLWLVSQVLPTAAETAVQVDPNKACMRFSLAQGNQAATGAGVNGRYELHERDTGRILATWQAGSQDTVSDWFYDISPAFAEGSWVEVFFFQDGMETAVQLTILNPAPNTTYGWIAPGQCHAIELEFPFNLAAAEPPIVVTSDPPNEPPILPTSEPPVEPSDQDTTTFNLT